MVAKPSGNKNKTRLARPVTTWLLYPDPCFSGRAGFRNLDPSDGGWFLNPMLTVVIFVSMGNNAKGTTMQGPGPQDFIFQHPLKPEGGPEGFIKKYQ